MLIRYPAQLWSIKKTTIENTKAIQYNMAKFDTQSLCKKYIFGMTLLHAHAHYICIVCAKYQKASVKALVHVDFQNAVSVTEMSSISCHTESNAFCLK